MKKIISLGWFFYAISVQAQLVVNFGNMTPQQYVQNVLVGQGVVVSNVTFSGDLNQIGSFNSLNANVGIDEGLILSTGYVSGAAGPNNSGSSTVPTGGIGGGGDADLTMLSGGTSMYDAAILEFDFVPAGDSIKFKYVFASEEYIEYANSSYNDAFGFFLSGPGISGPYSNGAENIALIPGTSTPVTINNVNHINNSSYYVDNGDGSTAPYNTDPQYIQYDGKTVILTAQAKVQCGQTYHLKIAIADGYDQTYDSGVFLQSGSLNSNSIQVDITTPTGDSTIIEGCGIAKFLFIRPDTAGEEVIHFLIEGNAINGVDYTQISDSIVFQASYDTTSISLEAFDDGIVESTDTLIITIPLVNPCGDTIYTVGRLYILDEPHIYTNLTDTMLACPIDSILIDAQAFGGVPPYNYNWNTGDTIANPYVYPIDGNNQFIVSITDSCAKVVFIDTVNIYQEPYTPLSLTLTSDTTMQCIDTLYLVSQVSGSATPYTYLWNTGATTDSIMVIPTTSTLYSLTITDNCMNEISGQTSVTIPIDPLTIQNIPDTLFLCPPPDSLYLDLIVSGGVLPYSIQWNTGDTAANIWVNSQQTDTFIVSVTDACQIVHLTDTVIITNNHKPLQVYTTPDTVFNCPLKNPFMITATGVDGGGTYTYLWNTSSTTSTIQVQPTLLSYYIVTVSDNCGENVIDSVMLDFIPYTEPQLQIIKDTMFICPSTDSIALYTLIYDGRPPYYIIWDNNVANDSIWVLPDTSRWYHVQLTDACLNTSQDSALVTVQEYQNITITPTLPDSICQALDIKANVQLKGGYGKLDILWSSGTFVSDSLAPIIPTEELGEQRVEITVSDECQEERTESYDVYVYECYPWIPNVISPNDDGQNDFLYIRNIQFYPSNRLEIYNRWGRKIYEKNNYNNMWDGQKLSDGVYYYILYLNDEEQNVLKGYFSVLK